MTISAKFRPNFTMALENYMCTVCIKFNSLNMNEVAQ